MLNIPANPSNQSTVLSGNGDHRDTLVVIFLRGGADGLNMLVPVEDDAYYTARTQTAIKKSDTLPLDNLFALHPLLKDLKPLFEEGQLLAVHGAGSEDTTRSHFEAQDYMEHGGITAGGWLGRYLRAANAGAGALSAVALGKTQPECLRGAPGILVMESFESLSFGEKAGQFLDTLLPAYEATPGLIGQAGRDLVAGVRRLAALNQGAYVPEHGAHYPEGAFGQNLARIAQLIKGRVGVRAATVDLDGWDAHFASATLMNPLLRQLGGGLLAFARDLGDTMQHTTVVVMTEFG
ncbi:MAG: DUF1501 domain-containing protein, partial [Candidatus Hydrogenedentes bacterium]|nr:DUF1501 domain-containing protein [Candidatus Hydrogenedentota bacterium]